MSKSERFFEIIQLLRQATRPVLARDLAEELGVSKRTIYRDIATLQSMRTPILGEPGIGYVMRRGYDLPPVNFDTDEAEAVTVGLSMVARTGDPDLWNAARRAARKLHDAAPGTRRLIAASRGVKETQSVSQSALRGAIREERKIDVLYCALDGTNTHRVVWPLALIYYSEVALLAGWCEMRGALRHFRIDRIAECTLLDDHFEGRSADLIAEWEATQKTETVTAKAL